MAKTGCFDAGIIISFSTTDGKTGGFGNVYRGGTLHWMTPAEAARARDELRIRLVFDLRSEDELAEEGISLLPLPPGRHPHAPILFHYAGRQGFLIVSARGTAGYRSISRLPGWLGDG